MQVQCVQNNKYKPNFQAVIRVKKNPKISDKVRTLVDKADSLYESIVGKKVTVNGVKIQPILGSGYVNKITNADSIRLSKNIDGMNVELTIDKPRKGTELDLVLTRSNGVSTTIHYDSLGFLPQKGHSEYCESLDTIVRDNFNLIHDVTHKGYDGYQTYAQKNAAFEKYASELLEPAEEMKKIFIG